MTQPFKTYSQMDDPTYFKKIIYDYGIEFTQNGPTHFLLKEQSLVVRDLSKYFEESENSVKKFVRGLEKLCENEDIFNRSLNNTLLKSISGNGGDFREITQEPLFRILLKITKIQPDILNIILNQITETLSEEYNANSGTIQLRLTLNCLRFLPFITDSDNLKTRLIDLIEISPINAQLEILDAIHDIVPDNSHKEIAKQLCVLLEDNNETLNAAIIDCLTFLNLDKDVKTDVQNRILSKLLAGSCLKIFPVYLNFLLNNNRVTATSETLVETLFKIRNALDAIMSNNSDRESVEERSSNILVILAQFKSIILNSNNKNICDAILSMISTIKSCSDHKAFDIVSLIMLYNVLENKRKIIEALVRKRVATGLFKPVLLEKLLANTKYLPSQFIKDYFKAFIQIGNSVLTNCDPAFGTTLFELLFVHDATHSVYRSEIVMNLVLLTSIVDRKFTSNILNIFTKLNVKLLREHLSIVMNLIDIINIVDLRDVKTIYEVLSSLIFDRNIVESTSFHDQLIVLVRKQISGADFDIKLRGIIGVVIILKYVIVTTNSNDKFIDTLLELVMKNTEKSCELKCIFYDELSFMIRVADIDFDNEFLKSLYDKITDEFTTVYLIENSSDVPNTSAMNVSSQYLLNSPEELGTGTAYQLNIAAASSESDTKLLASHFCLMRLLHHKYHQGDLGSIDMLLGCAIVLPEIDDLEDFTVNQLKVVTNCLFYCANWFREVISAFVTQKSKTIRAKVVRRLQDLIEIEEMLNNCLTMLPDGYCLPKSYCDSCNTTNQQQLKSPHQKSKARGKKKVKTAPNTTLNESVMNTQATSATGVETNIKKSKQQTPPKIYFRELDTDILLLLSKYPVNYKEQAIDSNDISLDLKTFKFLLQDFTTKLSQILEPSSNKSLSRPNNKRSLSHINVVTAASIINDCIKILPNINDNFVKIIIKQLRTLLELTDSRTDWPEMYTEDALCVKACFGLVIDVFHIVFSWSGFHAASNTNLDALRSILAELRGADDSNTLISKNRLVIDFINRLATYHEYCLCLEHGAVLVNTIAVLWQFVGGSNTQDMQKKLASTSGKLLSRRWYDSRGVIERGRASNLHINTLVQKYLCSASVKTLSGLVNTLQDQVTGLKSKDDHLEMLVAIDKQNFHVFYLGLCQSLLEHVRTEIQSLTNNQHLVLWQTTASTMQGLMSIAKIVETKSVLACFLKKSVAILKIFNTHGVPILEIMLKNRPDDVVMIFKTIQNSTRFLHQLCCTSKLCKDSAIIAHVPTFRLTLESLVYRVKAALVANNCSAAFWMGNLKNKDIYGEDVLSQDSITTSGGGGSGESQDLIEDEALPSDLDVDETEDDESMVTAEDGETQSENTSDSNVY